MKGDILMFTSTMAVVSVDEEADEVEVMLVSTVATGVKTSKLFRGVEAEITETGLEDAAITKAELEEDDS